MKHLSLMTPYVPKGVIEAVTGVLKTRWIGQGPKVDQFEQEFTELVGRPCVAVGSCTDALHLAYLLAGIGPGDEVIAPLFTCTATNIPLLYCGATIRFADVAPGALNVDPEAVARMVNERTKAIVIVHYGGAPVEKLPLWALNLGRYVPLIEDCAQALGASFVAKQSDYACFSFQAVKHVTTADGGMLVLPPQQVEEARRRRWFGIDRKAKLGGTWSNDIAEIGYKYQMTDIAAAMGIVGLEYLEAQIQQRRSMRSVYERLLSTIHGIELLDRDPESACWLCTVRVQDRASLQHRLRDQGIESDQVHYRNDRYTIFENFRGSFPNMDEIENEYLVLPMHMGMGVEDVERICSVIQSGW